MLTFLTDARPCSHPDCERKALDGKDVCGYHDPEFCNIILDAAAALPKTDAEEAHEAWQQIKRGKQ